MPKGIPNNRYTAEFKQHVIETMQKEGLSYRETARQFDVNSHHRIQEWERYLNYYNNRCSKAKGLAARSTQTALSVA